MCSVKTDEIAPQTRILRILIVIIILFENMCISWYPGTKNGNVVINKRISGSKKNHFRTMCLEGGYPVHGIVPFDLFNIIGM